MALSSISGFIVVKEYPMDVRICFRYFEDDPRTILGSPDSPRGVESSCWEQKQTKRPNTSRKKEKRHISSSRLY